MTDPIFIGIDNGVSGSIGWVGAEEGLIATPTFQAYDYQKTRPRQISRIDTTLLRQKLANLTFERSAKVFLERPLVNPKMFRSTCSAMRSLEATLIVLDGLKLAYEYLDSKSWQKRLLPSGLKGSAKLKKASRQIGAQLYPSLQEIIERQGDADGILIAEYGRRLTTGK